MTTTSSTVLLLLAVGASALIGLHDKVGAVSSEVADLQRQRWREKVPAIGIPKTLVMRLSPLSLTQLENFVTALKKVDYAASFDAYQFCRSADLLCREKVPYISSPQVSKHGNANPTVEEVKEHLFVDKQELRESGEVILPDLTPSHYLKSFLPRELAEMMPPFSTANVSQILNLFNIPSGSNMSRNMVRTLKMCELRLEEGEVNKYSTSVEGMVEFVVSLLGSDVDLFTDTSVVGSGQKVRVSKVARRENIVRGKAPVTCHTFVFPYGMMFCHSINGSEVFDLQMEVVQGTEKVTRNATVLCHYFSDGAGGNKAVCHPVYGEMLLWTPKPQRD